jgi:hypothetical protein
MLFFPLARYISKVLVTKEKQNSKGNLDEEKNNLFSMYWKLVPEPNGRRVWKKIFK